MQVKYFLRTKKARWSINLRRQNQRQPRNISLKIFLELTGCEIIIIIQVMILTHIKYYFKNNKQIPVFS